MAAAGVADQNRHARDIREQVAQAMCRIYNRMLEIVETEYVWTLEDDIVPPLDAAERLLRGFDTQTASVAGVYRSRFHQGYVAWLQDGLPIKTPTTGRQLVAGNGFGCTMIRKSALDQHVFASLSEIKDFDTAFYRRLVKGTLSAKIDWDCPCQHLEFK